LLSETATLILKNGFPAPGEDFLWSKEWQVLFEDAVFALQKSFEEVYELEDRKDLDRVMICDRGLLDIAAHLPGGIKEFRQRYGMTEKEALARYDAVVHLRSLAVSSPRQYGRMGNRYRFGSLDYAKKVEEMTHLVWKRHPLRFVIGNQKGIRGKVSKSIEIVRSLLDGKN